MTTAASAGELAQRVREALAQVIDPDLGESIVELGLIYSVAVGDDGGARIEMTTTTPGCPAAGYLKDAVETAAWNVEGIHYVEVRLTYEPKWVPEMMTDAVMARLGIERVGHVG